jgi:GAF domain
MTDFFSDADDSADRSMTAERASKHSADLQASLADLAGLVTGALGLQELLVQVASFAAHAIPGADGAGVTLLRVDRTDNRLEALAASAPFVTEIDEIVTLNEGPCITAALERRTVRSGSLGGEKMWLRGPRVGRLGVHSALSLPLLLSGQVVGAINVYAHGKACSTSTPPNSESCLPSPRPCRCTTPRSLPRRWRSPSSCRRRCRPGR